MLKAVVADVDADVVDAAAADPEEHQVARLQLAAGDLVVVHVVDGAGGPRQVDVIDVLEHIVDQAAAIEAFLRRGAAPAVGVPIMLKARSVTSEAAAATTERLADWRVLTTRLGDRVEFFDGLKVWVTWLEARLGVERAARRAAKPTDRHVKRVNAFRHVFACVNNGPGFRWFVVTLCSSECLLGDRNEPS